MNDVRLHDQQLVLHAQICRYGLDPNACLPEPCSQNTRQQCSTKLAMHAAMAASCTKLPKLFLAHANCM